MDPQHLQPHPHPPQLPLNMHNRRSRNRELLILPSPLTRVMETSRPTHSNQPQLDMNSHKVILPHTTKNRARVGLLPRIHIHNKYKDKDKDKDNGIRIIPLHNHRDTTNNSTQLRPLKVHRCTRRLNKGIMDI